MAKQNESQEGIKRETRMIERTKTYITDSWWFKAPMLIIDRLCANTDMDNMSSYLLQEKELFSPMCCTLHFHSPLAFSGGCRVANVEQFPMTEAKNSILHHGHCISPGFA